MSRKKVAKGYTASGSHSYTHLQCVATCCLLTSALSTKGARTSALQGIWNSMAVESR